MASADSIQLIDLHSQYLALQADIDAAVQRVLHSGWYILGREVTAFEREFALHHGLDGEAHCVGVNSGTDALHLALWACDVGPGDEVITVSHTAVATAAAIRLTGATPVFVDVTADTYTMDPAALAAAITPRTRAIVPVHLYGHPADMDALCALAAQNDIPIIEDCAQAHGATYRGKPVGTIGRAGCFSFYPTKNLGALGDGGAVISRDASFIERVRRLREYGWTPQSRYVSQSEGTNSRLDEMQAAILRAKLPHLDAWNAARRALAAEYAAQLPAAVVKPVEQDDCRHVYHLYVVRVDGRDPVQAHLRAAGIGTGIHYPVPIHRQAAYAGIHAQRTPLPQTEQIQHQILSLPMHPLLTAAQVKQVSAALSHALSTAPHRAEA
jgi:dTDP-4-amino-4,6-dideoxygalactose transaminase